MIPSKYFYNRYYRSKIKGRFPQSISYTITSGVFDKYWSSSNEVKIIFSRYVSFSRNKYIY